MSLICPVDLDTMMLRREISAMYARVATAPEGEFHFHRGPAYAAGMLGYDPGELERLPVQVTARFSGVGNPHAIAPLPTSATVVDVGCGGGMDLLLAAIHVGPYGRAMICWKRSCSPAPALSLDMKSTTSIRPPSASPASCAGKRWMR